MNELKKECLATAGQEMCTYVSPIVEVMEVHVELGFAVSDPDGDENTPGDIENGLDYEY